MVIWSSPAWPRRSSSLPNALTENGQVGSRNTSRTRGPWPQMSGSARHVFFIRSFLLRLVHKRRRPEEDQTLRPEKPRWPEPGETEIDFGFGGRQWRGNTHHPIGCTGAHDVGAQSEMQRLIGDGIGERTCRM